MKCGHTIFIKSCLFCKQLKTKWDDKLESSGFEDIEQDDGRLKLWAAHYFKSRFKNPSDLEFQKAKEAYYRRASQFLFEHDFTDKRAKRIWELHSKGVSIRSIVIILKKEGFKAYKCIVHDAIKLLSKEMKETPNE